MSDILNAMTSAASGMRAQTERLRLTAENIANADTPGFQRKEAVFGTVLAETGDAQAVEVARVALDRTPGEELFDPVHPMSDENGYVTLSNVDPIVEIADAREARRTYEANLNIFDQSRRMLGQVLDILKR